MSKSFLRAIAACALLAPFSANADPIRIDFTVVSTGSYVGGVINDGASYAGIAPGVAGGGYVVVDNSVGNVFDGINGIATLDLEFNWLGFTYTEDTARLFNIGFDATGDVSYWGFGPLQPTSANCGLNCYAYPGPNDFWVVGYQHDIEAFYPSNSHFHLEGYDGALYGAVQWTTTRAVPEPGTLGMMMLGLFGIAMVRRQRKA